jgi:hypothetical protein
MRKIAIAFLALGLAASFAVAPASATKFWTESFTYSDQALGAAPVGSVNAVTGWYTHSSGGNLGGSPTDIQIISGVANASHTNQPDDSRPFGAGYSITTGASDKTYACFSLYVPTMTSMLTTYQYFAHFKDNLTTGTTFTCKLYTAGIASDPTHFNLAINNTVTAGPYQPWTSPLSFDTWYTIAMLYDGATGISKLWVNPADETSPSVSANDPVLTGRLLGAFGLREISNSSAGTYRVDDISVGTTFDETCKGLPTPTRNETWGRLKTLYR